MGLSYIGPWSNKNLRLLFFYSHLMGMFYRTIRMVDNGIRPVYVFDGKPPDMKSGEVGKILYCCRYNDIKCAPFWALGLLLTYSTSWELSLDWTLWLYGDLQLDRPVQKYWACSVALANMCAIKFWDFFLSIAKWFVGFLTFSAEN
jgi:hypothetical protein